MKKYSASPPPSSSSLQLRLIGHFVATNPHSIAHQKLTAPRQSGMDRGQSGTIHVLPAFRDCLQDLEGFDHIWVIFQFHLNQSWKPLVLPPRSKTKRGVFATRSPYRPNSIGISCVKIKAIDDLAIQVVDTDLVNNTPIFDIKPYLAYCDSFPNASQGWTAESESEKFTLNISQKVLQCIQWIQERTDLPFLETLHNQLEFDPLNSKKKRVKRVSNNQHIFSYRTWRIHFEVQKQIITILSIKSGYTPSEMKKHDDPYKDKKLHEEFLKKFE